MWTPQQLLRHYDRGSFTKTGFLLAYMQSVTEDDVGRFLAATPADLMDDVRHYVDSCPRTENDWERLRWCHADGWVNPVPEHLEAAEAEERRLHRRGVEVLRDVLGPRTAAEPAWLRWGGGTLPKMARAIRDERAFERLPVLADGLEDAGCANQDILAHCREQGRLHVRDCWVLSLLLGGNRRG